MTTPEFNKIVEGQLDRIRNVLVKKQAEYNLDDDRLSVFKHGAGISEETPEQVLYGFMLKHIISVTDMINSKGTYSEELWNEKITDICNYLILLQEDAVVIELKVSNHFLHTLCKLLDMLVMIGVVRNASAMLHHCTESTNFVNFICAVSLPWGTAPLFIYLLYYKILFFANFAAGPQFGNDTSDPHELEILSFAVKMYCNAAAQEL